MARPFLPLQLAPGARSTLFVPVSARDGFGDGQVNATITGVALPGETFPPMQKQWKIGVRPAFPAQTVNSGVVLQPGERWQAPVGQTQGFSPATLQGQLVFSGKPPLNLARYIRDLKAYPLWLPGTDRQRSVPVALHQRRAAQSIGHRRRQ